MESNKQNVMVHCPKCQQLLSEHRLKKHLKKVHSAEAERKQLAEEIFRAREREAQNRIIQCHVCKSGIKRQNLEKHLKEKHGINTIPTLVMGNPKENNALVKPTSAWLSRFGSDKPELGNDIFDRGLVVSGGAVGMGKKK